MGRTGGAPVTMMQPQVVIGSLHVQWPGHTTPTGGRSTVIATVGLPLSLSPTVHGTPRVYPCSSRRSKFLYDYLLYFIPRPSSACCCSSCEAPVLEAVRAARPLLVCIAQAHLVVCPACTCVTMTRSSWEFLCSVCCCFWGVPMGAWEYLPRPNDHSLSPSMLATDECTPNDEITARSTIVMRVAHAVAAAVALAVLVRGQDCGPALGKSCKSTKCCSTYLWCGAGTAYCAPRNCLAVSGRPRKRLGQNFKKRAGVSMATAPPCPTSPPPLSQCPYVRGMYGAHVPCLPAPFHIALHSA
jgi:hypothetical protein